MKQARAYGLGVVLATQNPMDVDYRVLSNAGFWCLGRLSTDADRRRVVEAMTHKQGTGVSNDQLGSVLKVLAPRWFVLRDLLYIAPTNSAYCNRAPRCAGSKDR